MIRLWRWWRRRGPSAAAVAAQLDAQHSGAIAEEQFRDQTSRRVEADQVAAQARAHNTANRYDEWLRRVITSGGN